MVTKDRGLWAMMAFFWLILIPFVVGVVLASAGCSAKVPLTGSSGTPQEDYVLSETLRFAGMLGVRVTGVLTDTADQVPAGEAGCPAGGSSCLAAGWYWPGKAWYYRPLIVTYDLPLVSDIAAHETCHYLTPNHDLLHYNCILSVGAHPTYAHP